MFLVRSCCVGVLEGERSVSHAIPVIKFSTKKKKQSTMLVPRNPHPSLCAGVAVQPFLVYVEGELTFTFPLNISGISGEKFEVHPLQPKTPGPFPPLRSRVPVTYNMDQVVDCSRKAEKKGKLSLFLVLVPQTPLTDFRT